MKAKPDEFIAFLNSRSGPFLDLQAKVFVPKSKAEAKRRLKNASWVKGIFPKCSFPEKV